MQSHITIFTDGASSGNPGPGGWGTVISYNSKVIELGGAEKKTTNNRMELQAVLEGLTFVLQENLQSTPITLYTDSSYVANGITNWIKGWQKRNWTNQAGQPIANIDIWKEIAHILPDVQLVIVNISGHSGIAGNEQADRIATGFVKNTQHILFQGPRSDYDVDLENLTMHQATKKEKDRKKKKAYSYVSLLDGSVQIHYTWDECKARVDGKKGVKYKKSVSKEDEQNIIRSWGIKTS